MCVCVCVCVCVCIQALLRLSERRFRKSVMDLYIIRGSQGSLKALFRLS